LGLKFWVRKQGVQAPMVGSDVNAFEIAWIVKRN